MTPDKGLHLIVAQVDHEQTERADVARVARDDRCLEAQHVDAAAGLERAGPAEPAQGEVPDVEPPPHGHLADGVGLVPGRDLQHSGRALLGGQAEVGGQDVRSRSGRIDVERDPASEEPGGIRPRVKVGVGDRRFGATLAVTQGPGVGTGRAGPDLQTTLGTDPGDRATAGADGDDVDHRDLGRVATDRALGRQRRDRALHHGHVGRRAAAVEGQHPIESGLPVRVAAPSAPAAGPDNTVVIGWSPTASAEITPPLLFIT